jgi:hypothetical protein
LWRQAQHALDGCVKLFNVAFMICVPPGLQWLLLLAYAGA